MKDLEVRKYIDEIERLWGSIDGLKVHWTDGRTFIHKNGKWQLDKDK